MSIREYVQYLSSHDRHAIISSYEEFEKTGSTGETPIRKFTTHFMAENGINQNYVTMYMNIVAMECYRFYYDMIYKENGND